MDYFSCDSVHDLEVLGHFFSKIVLMPKYAKNRYNSILRWSWQKSKTSFDVKCGAEDCGFR